MDLDEAIRDWSKARGRPVFLIKSNFLSNSTARKCYSCLHDIQFDDLDVIIISPGGFIDSAFQIVKMLRTRSKGLTGVVPTLAASAATLIALGMDNLILGELGQLGPLDTQMAEKKEGDSPEYASALRQFTALEEIRKYSLETLDVATQLIISSSGLRMSNAVELAIELTKAVSEPLLRQINPVQVAESARANKISEEYGIRVLTRYTGCPDKKAKQMLRSLVQSYPTHDFIIDADELKELGLKAEYPEASFVEKMKNLTEAVYIYPEDKIELYSKEQGKASRVSNKASIQRPVMALPSGNGKKGAGK
jgi:hypothetical protein